LKAAQFPLNLFSMGLAAQTKAAATSLFLMANHVFGGADGITAGRNEIERMQQDAALPQALREKLDPRDETLLPEMMLNCILLGTGVSVAVPSMLQLKHLANNVGAVEHCRFSAAELEMIRSALAAVPRTQTH
jgi:aryl-alcohol dehydrogenase-like predicted oxidoreductase